jgi:hypothetical protein
MEQAGKSMTQVTNFGDYREVKGVKVLLTSFKT